MKGNEEGKKLECGTRSAVALAVISSPLVHYFFSTQNDIEPSKNDRRILAELETKIFLQGKNDTVQCTVYMYMDAGRCWEWNI